MGGLVDPVAPAPYTPRMTRLRRLRASSLLLAAVCVGLGLRFCPDWRGFLIGTVVMASWWCGRLYQRAVLADAEAIAGRRITEPEDE